MFDKAKEKLKSAANTLAYGAAPEGGPSSLEQVTFERLEGGELSKEELAGKVLLIVNVASRCGLTPQYKHLVALHETYQERGFLVVGVPCNQFLGQEPGSADEIASFCSVTYGVDFPLLAKQEVNGKGRSPLYQLLVGSDAGAGSDISWNFEKFLLGRDGSVVARFSPKTHPKDETIIAAIEAALGEPS